MRTLIIGGIKYRIIYRDIADTDEEDPAISEIDLMTNTIAVQSGLPRDQEHAAILHEVLHAMNWKLSEVDVEYGAQAWYAFLRKNRDFIMEILR